MKQSQHQSQKNITFMVSVSAIEEHNQKLRASIQKLEGVCQRIDQIKGQCDAANPFVFTLNGIDRDIQQVIAGLTQEVS